MNRAGQGVLDRFVLLIEFRLSSGRMPNTYNVYNFNFIHDFANNPVGRIYQFPKRLDVRFWNFSSAPGLLGSLLNMIHKSETNRSRNWIVCSNEGYQLLKILLSGLGPNYLVIHSFRFSLTS